MLDDRNKTAHIYDEAQAREIYQAIKDIYAGQFECFKHVISAKVAESGK
jgi:hypothetical protein